MPLLCGPAKRAEHTRQVKVAGAMADRGATEARRGTAEEVLERHALWRSAMSQGASESESESEDENATGKRVLTRRRSKTLLDVPESATATAHSRSLTILAAEPTAFDPQTAAAEARRFSKPGRVGSIRLVGLGNKALPTSNSAELEVVEEAPQRAPLPAGDAAAEYAAALAAYASITEGVTLGDDSESESSDGTYDPEAEAKVAAFFAAELAKEQSAQRRRGSVAAHEAAAAAAAAMAVHLAEDEVAPKVKKKKKQKKQKKTSAEKVAASQQRANERMRAKTAVTGGAQHSEQSEKKKKKTKKKKMKKKKKKMETENEAERKKAAEEGAFARAPSAPRDMNDDEGEVAELQNRASMLYPSNPPVQRAPRPSQAMALPMAPPLAAMLESGAESADGCYEGVTGNQRASRNVLFTVTF